MTTTNHLPDVNRLYVDTVDVSAVSVDWSEGYGESWSYHAAPECPECGDYAVWRESSCESWEAWRCDNVTECNTAASGDEIENEDDGPMMNYHYPLPSFDSDRFDAREAATKIRDLPLCVIEWEQTGDYSLALSGGGMDLSWEIAEAFMRLGYLPPLAYCDLPDFAGMDMDERKRWIVSGCLRTTEVIKAQADRRANDLRRYADR
jgi:hypothetical protein